MSDDRQRALIDDTGASPALQTRVIPIAVEAERRRDAVRQAASSLGPTFTRYCLVGGSGYVVNAAIFWAAARFVPYPVAFALAFVVAATSNFCLNRRWTFAATSHRPAASQFGRFLAVSVAALVSDLAVLSLLVEAARLPELLSALIAIGFTTPVSFGANRLWTFSHR
ncbi:MAG: GtrA family protein [Gaiellales bacterium]